MPNMDTLSNPFKGVERVNMPITDIKGFTEYVNKVTEKDKPYTKKYFCVMLFYEQWDITNHNANGIEWINTHNEYFRNGVLALDYYANTPCPASQLIDAETIEELAAARNQMLLNFKDEQFLKELYEQL